MQTLDLIPLFVEPLERAGFPYMITGSVASMIYGMARVEERGLEQGWRRVNPPETRP